MRRFTNLQVRPVWITVWNNVCDKSYNFVNNKVDTDIMININTRIRALVIPKVCVGVRDNIINSIYENL